MNLAELAWSEHASQRQQQRAVRQGAVEAALRWGRQIPQHNHRTAFFLDRKSASRARHFDVSVDCFVGTAVVLAADGTVVTVIRCSDAGKLKRYSK